MEVMLPKKGILRGWGIGCVMGEGILGERRVVWGKLPAYMSLGY